MKQTNKQIQQIIKTVSLKLKKKKKTYKNKIEPIKTLLKNKRLNIIKDAPHFFNG